MNSGDSQKQQSSLDRFQENVNQIINNYPEYCMAIAFNLNNDIMMAGSNEFIKVFELLENRFEQTCMLKGHFHNVYCIYFMKKFPQFISASVDLIIIWKLVKNQNWIKSQTFTGHSTNVNCLTMNTLEDLFIVGLYYKRIQFWQKFYECWDTQFSLECDSIVWGISFDDQQNRLIASMFSSEILIIQQEQKSWMIKQRIKVKQFGMRLCFITEKLFVFQPFGAQHLEIYSFNQDEQEFIKEQELKYEKNHYDMFGLFPIQYSKSQNILVVKNNQFVRLIKITQEGCFKIEQTIHYNSCEIFGCLSNDGQLLATWDCNSKEIQIRKTLISDV